MTNEELDKRFKNDRNSAVLIGREFFAKISSKDETRSFLEWFIENKRAEELADVIGCGFINNTKFNQGYFTQVLGVNSFESRYFNLLLGLCSDVGVDKDKLLPIFILAYSSPKNSMLRSWVQSVDAYLLKCCYENYKKMREVFAENPNKIFTFSVLMRADYDNTLVYLLDLLLNGKNVDKVEIRKFLMDYPIDITAIYYKDYNGFELKKRLEIIKLAIMFKNDIRVKKFLDEVLINEKSKSIKNIIIKDFEVIEKTKKIESVEFFFSEDKNIFCIVKENKNKLDASEESNLIEQDLLEIEIPKKEEQVEKKKQRNKIDSVRINMDSMLVPKVEQVERCPRELGKAVTRTLTKIKKEIEHKKNIFIENMVMGESITLCEFLDTVLNDPINSLIASSLFFSIYKNENLLEIVVVDKCKILDLDNNEIEFLDTDLELKTIRVLHPIEISSKYSFIKQLNITQPIEQIARKVFYLKDDEKKSNCVERFKGSVIPARDFISNMRNNKFKILNKDIDGVFSSVGILRKDIMCVLEFSKVTQDSTDLTRNVTVGDVKFYNYADLIKLNSQIYTDGVPLVSLSQIEKRDFSEFLYSITALLGAKK